VALYARPVTAPESIVRVERFADAMAKIGY